MHHWENADCATCYREASHLMPAPEELFSAAKTRFTAACCADTGDGGARTHHQRRQIWRAIYPRGTASKSSGSQYAPMTTEKFCASIGLKWTGHRSSSLSNGDLAPSSLKGVFPLSWAGRPRFPLYRKDYAANSQFRWKASRPIFIKNPARTWPRTPHRNQADCASSSSPTVIGWAIVSCSLSTSSSPSHRLMTMVATPLPTRLVSARHSLMNLSMPTRIASD